MDLYYLNTGTIFYCYVYRSDDSHQTFFGTIIKLWKSWKKLEVQTNYNTKFMKKKKYQIFLYLIKKIKIKKKYISGISGTIWISGFPEDLHLWIMPSGATQKICGCFFHIKIPFKLSFSIENKVNTHMNSNFPWLFFRNLNFFWPWSKFPDFSLTLKKITFPWPMWLSIVTFLIFWPMFSSIFFLTFFNNKI